MVARKLKPQKRKTAQRRAKVGIQDWSDNIILVNLAQEPDMSEELNTVAELVLDRGNCDVTVDFSSVDIVTSSNIAKLLKLRKLLSNCKHRLVLCGLKPQTKNIFLVTGLEDVFEFVDDKFVALASLQMVN